jgi:ribosomal protein S4
MLSNKIYKKYGDIWGELFRLRRPYVNQYRAFDIYGRRPKNNSLYYRFSFYVGRFGVVRRRKTRYGKAFADKQKLKLFYNNIPESHIRFKWAKSLKYKDHAMFKFFHYLESRLDVLLLRANYVFNIKQGESLVKSGSIVLNGKIMLDNTYMVQPFQIIKVNVHNKILSFFRRLLLQKYKMFPLPTYLKVDYKTSTILYTGVDSIPFYPFKIAANKLRVIYR